MTQENNSDKLGNLDKINFLLFQEYIRLIQTESLLHRAAKTLACENIARQLGVEPRALGKGQNFHQMYRLVSNEFRNLLKAHATSPRTTWNLAAETIAKRIDVDTNEFTTALKGLSIKRPSRDPEYVWEAITNTSNQVRLARHESWHEDQELFEAALRIIYDYDPLGITDHLNGPSEYSLEVDTILPRLEEANSEEAVWQIVYEEFVIWFNTSAQTNCYRYDPIAAEIWALIKPVDA